MSVEPEARHRTQAREMQQAKAVSFGVLRGRTPARGAGHCIYVNQEAGYLSMGIPPHAGRSRRIGTGITLVIFVDGSRSKNRVPYGKWRR